MEEIPGGTSANILEGTLVERTRNNWKISEEMQGANLNIRHVT